MVVIGIASGIVIANLGGDERRSAEREAHRLAGALEHAAAAGAMEERDAGRIGRRRRVPVLAPRRGRALERASTTTTSWRRTRCRPAFTIRLASYAGAPVADDAILPFRPSGRNEPYALDTRLPRMVPDRRRRPAEPRAGRGARGFTLVEILVALAVLAVALAAGMRAVAQAADGATMLKQRTLGAVGRAEPPGGGAARNRPGPRPAGGTATPAQAGSGFVWRETVTETPNPAFRKIEIVVADPRSRTTCSPALRAISGSRRSDEATVRAGFTLIELLIALAILGLVAVLGYRALAALTESEAKLAAEAAHWRALDALFARLEADVRDALPRDVRTGGGAEAAWVGDVDAAGDADPALLPRGPRIRGRTGERRPTHRLPPARWRRRGAVLAASSTSHRR